MLFRRLLFSQIGNLLINAFDAVVGQLDILRFGTQPDADSFRGAALFDDAILDEFDGFGAALNVDADSLVAAAVDDLVSLDVVAVLQPDAAGAITVKVIVLLALITTD